MSTITTIQAIQLGIESIKMRDNISPQRKERAIHLLSALEQSDWYKGWDKDSIIKALYDYKERTGIAPTASNLKEHGMPNSVTIRSYFHMSPSLLLKRLFPENNTMENVNLRLSNPFGFETEEAWLNCFVEQFKKHGNEGMSCKKYDVLRDKDTPTWSTIARHCGLSTWNSLLKKANVQCSKKNIETATAIHIKNSTSPTITKLEEINRQREKLNTELYNILYPKK